MITGLNHITLAVLELERSLHFYQHLLGFKGHVKWQNGAYLSAGDLWLCLSVDEPCPKTDYSHIALSVESGTFHQVCERLKAHPVVQWKNNSSEGESLYLLDPDGHKLEVHVGSLASRLNALKSHPYQGLEWL
ncbi:fosfomycin resistance glutathione transferase [Celerinatantimonas sp. MCCC 1A17872]|uniref:fosfomycin resistance glutathione transferase n=1 Tax=Celerinatantimonas sp. MCCC 1A17872 TaxID=3177514 RepID=UPI0038C6CC4F